MSCCILNNGYDLLNSTSKTEAFETHLKYNEKEGLFIKVVISYWFVLGLGIKSHREAHSLCIKKTYSKKLNIWEWFMNLKRKTEKDWKNLCWILKEDIHNIAEKQL